MNFSPGNSSVAGFIDASLTTLRNEFPTAYFLMCALLSPREVRLSIDGEEVTLNFSPDGAYLLAQPHHPTVELRTSRQTILDVIDARMTLYESVLANDILLQGSPNDLAICHEGLLIYVRGAVRSPSFPFLLERFRQTSSGGIFA